MLNTMVVQGVYFSLADSVGIIVQLQAPPKRKNPPNWPELQRLVSKGEHVKAKIIEVNRCAELFSLTAYPLQAFTEPGIYFQAILLRDF